MDEEDYNKFGYFLAGLLVFILILIAIDIYC